MENVLQYLEEFEDTKVLIRIRKWKKDRQHNSQKKKDKGQTIISLNQHVRESV